MTHRHYTWSEILEERDEDGNLTAAGFCWRQPVPTWHKMMGGMLSVLVAGVLLGAWGTISYSCLFGNWWPFFAFLLIVGFAIALYGREKNRMDKRGYEPVTLLFTTEGEICITTDGGRVWRTHKRSLLDIGSIEMHAIRNMGGGHFRFEHIDGEYPAYAVVMYFRTGETDRIARYLMEGEARLVAARLNLALQHMRNLVGEQRESLLAIANSAAPLGPPSAPTEGGDRGEAPQKKRSRRAKSTS